MLAFDDGDRISRGLDRGVIASFAGLDFELRGDRAACALLARAPGVSSGSAAPLARDDGGFAEAPKFAVRCALELVCVHGAAHAEPARAPISWRWHGGHGEVLTRSGRADVWRGPRGFEARAQIAPGRSAPQLLAGLAALLLHRSGGAILHAASVELDGGVVAFVGPSGAGKSTACRHVDAAGLFSVDRLAVLPGAAFSRGAAWLSHPLSGGTPLPDTRMAAPRTLPLRGVLRVHQSARGTWLEAAPRAGAVAALRESAFQVGSGGGAEAELLETLEQLALAVPVARLHLNLGASLAPLVRRWLVDPGKET